MPAQSEDNFDLCVVYILFHDPSRFLSFVWVLFLFLAPFFLLLSTANPKRVCVCAQFGGLVAGESFFIFAPIHSKPATVGENDC